MDESLRQQILAADLLRPHSLDFSNCSYLLRQKRKKKTEQTSFCDCTVVSALLPPPSRGWDSGCLHVGHGAPPAPSPARAPLPGTRRWLLGVWVLMAGW